MELLLQEVNEKHWGKGSQRGMNLFILIDCPKFLTNIHKNHEKLNNFGQKHITKKIYSTDDNSEYKQQKTKKMLPLGESNSGLMRDRHVY